MARIVLRSVFFVVLAAILSNANLSAQKEKGALSSELKDAPAAPMPAQILSAKKVFIANGGTAVWGLPRLKPFHGGPTRAYDQFYAAMKSWGRYELVGSPADADLVLEISFLSAGSAGDFPSLHLAIVDPKTHILIWAINENVEFAALQGHRDNNFDQAISKLVGDVKDLDAHAKAAESAQK